jgi:iron(III) transport system ATP-binding protein
VARFVGGAAILPATVAAGIARCALGEAPVHGSVADGEVEVVVRPEQVTIRPGHGARVGDVSFYGHDAAVRLELLPDGPSLVARVPGLSAPDPGTEVGVGLAGPLFVIGD